MAPASSTLHPASSATRSTRVSAYQDPPYLSPCPTAMPLRRTARRRTSQTAGSRTVTPRCERWPAAAFACRDRSAEHPPHGPEPLPHHARHDAASRKSSGPKHHQDRSAQHDAVPYHACLLMALHTSIRQTRSPTTDVVTTPACSPDIPPSHLMHCQRENGNRLPRLLAHRRPPLGIATTVEWKESGYHACLLMAYSPPLLEWRKRASERLTRPACSS